ncbi:MAG: hypothetical protein HKN36_00445 [Hellea sp.]|nr:hypothetical protein [Marinicaulis sp.]NNE56553.1 hypothetical protein [Hellea sp.]
MASAHIDASLLTVFLTSTGFIALCSNQLNEAQEAATFGSTGAVPPQSMVTLLDDLLTSTQNYSEPSDLQDLTDLRDVLSGGVTKIDAYLAKHNP